MKNFVRKLFFCSSKKRVNELEQRVRLLEHYIDVIVQRPIYLCTDENGFNSQDGRKSIFKTILKTFQIDAIIETGTWVGDTTGYMACASNLPVYSCEINSIAFHIALKRLSEVKNTFLTLSDSRSFLSDVYSKVPKETTIFFYLDAHWFEDFPLVKEIELIEGQWSNFIIMIDDFKVPGDDGYGYDIYNDTSLSIELVASLLSAKGLDAFFPSLHSTNETGKKRGSVIITRKNEFSEKLEMIDLLRKYDVSPN